MLLKGLPTNLIRQSSRVHFAAAPLEEDRRHDEILDSPPAGFGMGTDKSRNGSKQYDLM
jgi:hypothetical protein